MNARTLCLNLLVLASTAFPGQALRLTLAGRRRPELVFAVALVSIAALALVVVPVRFHLPERPVWYLVAASAGLAALLVEYLAGVIASRRFGRLTRHSLAGGGGVAALAVSATAAAEEVLFRGIALPLLGSLVGLAAAVGVTSVVYGLNHLYFGWLAVVQKTLTGAGFGLLFVLSGQSVIVVIVAHAVQNLIVQLAVPR
jgi:uncharacterized protein